MDKQVSDSNAERVGSGARRSKGGCAHFAESRSPVTRAPLRLRLCNAMRASDQLHSYVFLHIHAFGDANCSSSNDPYEHRPRLFVFTHVEKHLSLSALFKYIHAINSCFI